MKVSDYIACFLEQQRVTHVFEMSGGMITHLLDSLNRRGRIHVVSTHHEQAAAFAAEAMGRITGIPGVALATSGPGATNLLTGIGSCYFDSSPAVFITGQVNRSELRGDRHIRQLGFQETDIVSIARPITKGAWQAKTPEEIPLLLRRAFDVAAEGRPGPVLLDIPMDVQRYDLPSAEIELQSHSARSHHVDRSVLDELLRRLEGAERPLVLVGGGVCAANASEHLRQLIGRLQVPVINSLMAVDFLTHDDPLRVGMIGTYGNSWANLALGRSDFLLVLGSRLDIRQTGSDVSAFKGDRTIYHVDVEPGEMNNRVSGCIPIESDLRDFADELDGILKERRLPVRRGWLAEIAEVKHRWPDTHELVGTPGINPNVFLHEFSSASSNAAVYTVDVGLHQMWTAQSVEIGKNQRFLTSGGMGSMGFALPAAIGAAFAVSPNPVACIAGDGGFQTNIQELQTVIRNRLPIKMVILNNRCHGMVRQFQESYFEGRYQSTYWGYSAPDFARVAESYGISSFTIDNDSEVPDALRKIWRDPTTPFLLQVMIDTFANAYPKIAFGRPITEMEPEVQPMGM